MASIKEWRKAMEKLDADQIEVLLNSFDNIHNWPIMKHEYGELRTIIRMLKARAEALSKQDDDTAKCLACSYRVDGLCPLVTVEVL